MLLQGLKVVELSTWVAGPGCAAIMADWGAEVIKIEGAAGDPTRTYYPDTAEAPANPVFALNNRGKKSVVLDTATAEGRADLVAILKDADIFITNLRPGSLKRARLDYASMKDELPRLIYASITGFGLIGEAVDKPAFDLTGFWTLSGLGAATLPPDVEPFTCRPAMGDHTTALATLGAVLAALHERHSTGKGRLVETSLLRTAHYVLGWDLSILKRFGEVQTAVTREDRPNPLSNFFQTSDGVWLCLVPRGPRCMTAMMQAIGRTDVLDEPRYAYPVQELEAAREVRRLLDAWFAGLTYEKAADSLTKADMIFAKFTSIEEAASSQMARDAGCFVAIDDGWGGTFETLAAPARFPEGAPPVGAAAPRLGADTEAVLAAVRSGGGLPS